MHGYEAIPVVNVNCDARYFKFERILDGKIQWILVIQHGLHTHIDPIPRPTRSAISKVVEDTVRTNLNAIVLDVSKCLKQRYGLNTSNASVRKVFKKLRSTCGGYGKSVEDVSREYRMTANDNFDSYALSNFDEREND